MPDVLEVDVTGMVRAYLADTLHIRVATELPANLADALPLARPVRTGGPDDGHTLDAATIVTHWFAATDLAARQLAYQGCTALREMRGVVLDWASVTLVRKLSGPFWADYQNPNVRQYVTLHELRVTAV